MPWKVLGVETEKEVVHDIYYCWFVLLRYANTVIIAVIGCAVDGFRIFWRVIVEGVDAFPEF